MTKFEDRRAPGYEDVIRELRRMANNAETNLTDQEPTVYVPESNIGKCGFLCNNGLLNQVLLITSETPKTQHPSATPSSPIGSLPLSTNNYGSGAINANIGQGTQNNNTGSGKQFVGERQYFAKEDLG